MSGEVKQNASVASGAIGAAPSATESASDPLMTTNPEDVGAEWHNTTSGQIFICKDNTAGLNVWIGQKGGRVYPVRGILMGGQNAASPSVAVNTIDYVTIPNIGNATDFGDMSGVFKHMAATSNGMKDRAVSGGGMRDTGSSLNIMEYVTISSTGNTTDFGDLTTATRQFSATSNGSNDRGVWGGGYSSSNTTINVLQYVTISSAGNATDFGDATTVMQDNAATSNGTNERGIWMGGNRPSLSNIIDYITISTTGNSTDFGDLSTNISYPAACSNHTNERGVRLGGYDGSGQSNVIEYVTINTTGNVTDFGDLITAIYGSTGTSSGTEERGLSMGGYPGGVNTNVIEYITISSTGDGQDFGDLTVARQASQGAASDAG